MVARGIGRPRNVGDAMDTIKNVPTYARLVWGLARDPRVPLQHKLVLGGVAAYLALPIDIIPDSIPVIGELDDLAVLIIGLDWFIRNAPADVVDEHMARIAKHEDALSQDLASAGSILADRAAQLRATLERIRTKEAEG